MRKIKKFIQTNKNYLIYVIIYLLSNWYLFKLLNTTVNKWQANALFFAVSILAFISFLIILKYKNNHKETHKIFFMISLCYGILYLIFIPAICGTDEYPHFQRIYQISAGDIIVKNTDEATKMPQNLLDFIQFDIPLSTRYTKESVFKSVNYNVMGEMYKGSVASGYPPNHYIPQVIGISIAKILKLSPAFTLYLVRLFNFIVWLIIMTKAIKIAPIHKKSLTLFFTCPAILSLVTTSTMDALPTAIMIYLICLIFNIKYEKRKVTKKEKIIIVIISLLFSTYKLFYLILLLLIFLIPKTSYKNNKEKIAFTALIILASLILDLLWYGVTKDRSSITGVSLGAQQIEFVLKDPINYIFVILNTLIGDFFHYFTNLFGGSEMCYSKANLNQLFIISYIILYFYILFNSERNNIKLTNKEKIFIILLMLIIIGLVASSMYVGWTVDYLGVGSNKIVGIQSRYFFILIPLVIFLIKNKRIKSTEKIFDYVELINAILLVNTISSVFISIIK